MRLDLALVERGLAPNRSRARDAIRRGCVRVEGTEVRKSGAEVDPAVPISVADPAGCYVSRAALKLLHGLELFGVDVTGMTALDLGASTGGFTQVLLERGAARVTAVDVGHGQLSGQLASDPRVTVIEGLNARDLTAAHLPARPDLIVADLSFISLRLALPPALDLAAPGARCVLLVKPQFEVGRQNIGKGGIVPMDRAEWVSVELRDWLDGVPDWHATGLAPSPIVGGSGNREWLLGGAKTENPS